MLDQGFHERYFTAAQRLALARRDHDCSFPGCTIPPQWCEAHHITEWSLGGPTNLANGALICGRHHTMVRNRGITAHVGDDGVTWLLNGVPVSIGPAMPRIAARPSTESLPVGAQRPA
ncbi:MAG TPA: HNH endonuclease signature motif containing protein [Intrasporangium sp.]|uniref:HNH endonuclease signature motif containing protein n=1 Tax=Intrasporangium sp. TaxID=1925024 RepID=UPI002B46BCC9|nr:HNH endonuclease signature motif containing protein [Intrasporangium sp.]HKX69264.1 HNH endonuclease signature motif containing protein [Intrasporangium sp.]